MMPLVATSVDAFMPFGHFAVWFSPALLRHSPACIRPLLMTYSNASSAVAPSQPPSPPQCFGFGVHAISWLVAHWIFFSPLISARACMLSREACAQQLPQVPWSLLFALMASRCPQPKSSGMVLWTAPLPLFASRKGVEPRAAPPPPRRVILWPRSVASSCGVQSVRWLISARCRTAGSQLWLAIRAARVSKTTWRIMYSSVPTW
mmetsp:Transcript_56143/g.156381  ORF Transcript_56143/g.156381 Transcript_56143/m.156381 type:complete len:205 (+) Transcript_56143:265-879(+)